MFKKIFFIFFGLFCFLNFLAATDTNSERLSDTDVVPVVNETYYNILMNEIKNAKESIFIISFEFNNDRTIYKIADALKEVAEQRGVKIKLLCDSELKKRTNITFKKFQNTKIEYKLDTEKKRTHCKLFIFDKQKVLLGSTNLSGQSIMRNNETNILIKNSKLAEFYSKYFEQIWEDSYRTPKVEKVILQNAEPVMNRDYFPVVKNLIYNSQKYIYLYMYGLKFNPENKKDPINILLNGMVAAKNRGVDVKVVVEKSDYNTKLNELNNEVADFLRNNKIEVRYDPENKTSHAKLLIVDDTVVIGSTNWAYGAMMLNNEANILLKVNSVTKFFKQYFLNLWENK